MSGHVVPDWFNEAVVEAFFAGDVDGFLGMYADDAVHEFPFSPEGWPQRLEGKAAIAEYMQQLPGLIKFDSLDIISLRELGDELIVEATADGTRPGTGAPFHMRYVWFITRVDGKVTLFRDYMNPLLLSSR